MGEDDRRGLLRGIVSAACLAVMAAVSASTLRADTPAAIPNQVEFNRDIRPILSDKCWACHGPDRSARKADLRLDIREGAVADLGGYAAVSPGNPEDSELLRRVTADDDDERMPPPESHKPPLTGRQVALLRRWIEQGARWQGHWAFVPPNRPPVPRVEMDAEVRNPIDHFIRARLASEGLRPSPPADRRTLIRRLSFDLIGLPPTPGQVEAFLADPSADAYEQLADRLLASPHFGERMAMYWLDLVRYADTVGFHGDQPYSVWPYRDYVIRAFNRNMSFDRFTIEQIAGDLLSDATKWQKVASGYNRLNMITAEGGAQAGEYLAIYAADRVRTTAGAWLGVTLGCAQCHDHKYDPFTSKDFYSFAAFFADLKERGVYGGAHETGQWGPSMPVPTPQQEAELAALDRKIDRLGQTLRTPTPELAEAQRRWEQTADRRPVDWIIAQPGGLWPKEGVKLQTLDDGSVLASDITNGYLTYTVELPVEAERVSGLRLEALTHESLPSGGPGFAPDGDFSIQEVRVKAGEEEVKLTDAFATASAPHYPVRHAIDGRGDTAWRLGPHTGADHAAYFQFDPPIQREGDRPLKLRVELQQSSADPTLLGRFRLSVTGQDEPVEAVRRMPDAIRRLLETPEQQRTDEQRQRLAEHYRSIAPLLEPVRRELAATEQQRRELVERIPTTLTSVSVEPRTMRILPRGNWMDDSGQVVRPAVPHFLPQPRDAGDRRLTRLDLAEWLVSRDNPLTARVFVNRLWRMFFGAGLSKVLDDVGSQGEWPTHPRLLDWLAVEFMESGWDVKHIVKLMVMSGTYRQSSEPRSDLRQLDPYNRLLARQSRWRLDAEQVRDHALVVSGLLETAVGGRSVRPYQPPGYYAQLNFPKREYQHDEGADLWRRSLYTHWQRTFLHPMMLAFDAPSREECTAERPRSNTPIQALVLLNDPEFVEAARALAERIIRERGPDDRDRIAFAFELATTRPPTDEELSLLLSLYEDHKRHYAAETESARDLLSIGERPIPTDLDTADLAAWTSVARAVINLSETITRN